MTSTISESVAKILAASPIPHFIGGKPQKSADGRTWDVINPSNGQVITKTSLGGPPEINAAVEAAHTAFPGWSATPPSERAAILHRFAQRLEDEAATLAQIESLDVGKTITLAENFDIPFGIKCVRYYADLAVHAQYDVPLEVEGNDARTFRAPYGVCGFIFPWNFPFDLLMWGVIPAIAAGNTVVVKPSEVTPLSTLYVARLAAEAGVPAGVINVVVGNGKEAGEALTTHPLIRRMSFTGSPEVGAKVGEICGRRLIPCKLELGGKGAAVIFDDVDVLSTATQLAGAITMNTGQVCCTATRWLVHEKIYEQFVEAVTDILSKTKVGPSLDPATEMGPMVSKVQQDRVLSYLEKGKADGATAILDGGKAAVPAHEQGFYVKPYLLAGTTDNVCFREEIFGPTAYLTRFSTEDEAVRDVNSISYGLANSVWSADLQRANRVAEKLIAGNNWINAHNVFAYGLPYGGINRSGLGGGVNGPNTFYDYLRETTVARPVA